MIKILTEKYILLFVLITFIASCENKVSPDITEPKTIDTTGNIYSNSDSLEDKSLKGPLHILWMDSASFMQLDTQRIVFKFFVESANTWSLRGWSNNDNNFGNQDDDPTYLPPNVILKPFKKSEFKFKKGDYFGNLLLRKGRRGVKKIRELIVAQSAKYVIFYPRDPDLTARHITYDIILTRDNIESLMKDADGNLADKILTGLKMNPSPPRNAKQGNPQEQ